MLQASTAWTKLGMWEQSDVVLAFAASAADTACRQPLLLPAQSAHKAEQLCVLLFDVSVARYLTAAKLDQQAGATAEPSVGRHALSPVTVACWVVGRRGTAFSSRFAILAEAQARCLRACLLRPLQLASPGKPTTKACCHAL